jgi:hypothetical protein
MLGPFTAPRFAAAMRGAELHRLPGCGHVPMADDPAAVAAAIVGFRRPEQVDGVVPATELVLSERALLELDALHDERLAPHGISARQLAVLLLLDAREGNDLVAFILNTSQIFVGPFEGILRTDALRAGGSVFDVAAVLAIVGWSLLEALILAAVGVFRREPA